LVLATIQFRFKFDLHLAVLYFDEILGPQTMALYPELDEKHKDFVEKILTKIMDLGALDVKSSWQFMYSDLKMTSQNLSFKIPHPNARGGSGEFMICLLLLPSYSHGISVLSSNWKTMYSFQDKIIDDLTMFLENKNLDQLISNSLSIFEEIYLEYKEYFLSQLELLSPSTYEFG